MPLGTDGTRQTQGTRAERGNNHAWGRGAITAAAVLCGVLLLPDLTAAQASLPLDASVGADNPADNPLVQRDVPAEAKRRLLLAHRMAAVLHHDDLVIVALQEGQRLGKQLHAILRVLGHPVPRAWRGCVSVRPGPVKGAGSAPRPSGPTAP